MQDEPLGPPHPPGHGPAAQHPHSPPVAAGLPGELRSPQTPICRPWGAGAAPPRLGAAVARLGALPPGPPCPPLYPPVPHASPRSRLPHPKNVARVRGPSSSPLGEGARLPGGCWKPLSPQPHLPTAPFPAPRPSGLPSRPPAPRGHRSPPGAQRGARPRSGGCGSPRAEPGRTCQQLDLVPEHLHAGPAAPAWGASGAGAGAGGGAGAHGAAQGRGWARPRPAGSSP